ncbi:MAG: 3-deoxy-D-manno-octulosonic acid transferase [Caulobacter sp.]|nr:3-deoxy-D-manno-octulosonic acid transferase [Vitreoscilla sp.]
MTLKQRLALVAYSFALRLLLPAILVRYWLRGRKEPGYRVAMRERLGFGPPVGPGSIWVHAVSLGESRASSGLTDALRLRRAEMRLLLTHGTATGRDAGQVLMRNGDRQSWLPLDTPGAVRRFLLRTRPAIGVLMETEIWPNLLHAAQERGVTMVLANARLSERSARRGQRLAALMRPAAGAVTDVLAQTEDDAERLREAGATRVALSGNLKFDVRPSPALLARGRKWHAAIGRPVVLAAITREGEEAELMREWGRIQGRPPFLIVVPRHPQRFDEVETLLVQHGLRVPRRSSWGEMPPDEALKVDAWLGDSLGEMPQYYASADVALLGGSFMALGGHNLIEAAASGCPIVMGPSTFNFAEAARQAALAGAAWQESDMAHALRRALQVVSTDLQTIASARALAFAATHKGAADRMADRIVRLL